MPISHYSVLQYVPDMTTGERMNVGLIGFSEGRPTLVQVVQSWERVRQFSSGDISALKEFVAAVDSGAGPVRTAEDARSAAKAWHYAVHFTDPQPSLLPPEQLLADLAPRFLRGHSRE